MLKISLMSSTIAVAIFLGNASIRAEGAVNDIAADSQGLNLDESASNNLLNNGWYCSYYPTSPACAGGTSGHDSAYGVYGVSAFGNSEGYTHKLTRSEHGHGRRACDGHAGHGGHGKRR